MCLLLFRWHCPAGNRRSLHTCVHDIIFPDCLYCLPATLLLFCVHKPGVYEGFSRHFVCLFEAIQARLQPYEVEESSPCEWASSRRTAFFIFAWFVCLAIIPARWSIRDFILICIGAVIRRDSICSHVSCLYGLSELVSSKCYQRSVIRFSAYVRVLSALVPLRLILFT